MTFNTRLLRRLLVALVLTVLALFVAAQVSSQITGEIGDNIDVGVNTPDMSFFSADTIDLKVTSTDDVFAVGGEVNVGATSADHLVVAGGDISVRNVTIEDLFAAGGDLQLVSGNVADDIVVAGGEVFAGPGFAIGGSAVIAGGEARIEAPIAVDLRANAGSVYLNSTVGGDARLTGDTVTLGPKARIGGDLLYQTDNLVVQPGAIIAGEREILPAQEHSAFESWGRGAGELFAVLTIATIVGFAILVMVIAVAVPGLMRSSAELMHTKPLRSLGIGVLVAVCVPLLVVLLFASIIGAPLGLMLAAICLAITPVSLAATAFLIGQEIRYFAASRSGRDTQFNADPKRSLVTRLAWPALGAAILFAFGMVPLLGLLVWLFAMLFGLGAIVSRGGRALAVAQ